MQKASKEAKVHTTWTEPNAAYEQAMHRFIQAILDPGTGAEFLADFGEFQKRIAFFGQFNSLAQVVLKIASPGVPDFYQGAELWDFNLVDPDNRRPVDYTLRRGLLADLKQRKDCTQDLLKRSHTGEVKLFVTNRALAFRKRFPEIFREGDYLPLQASGPKQDHVLAFARRLGTQATLAVVPRLVVRLVEGKLQPPQGSAAWQDTRLNLSIPGLAGRFRDVFTGQELANSQGADGPFLLLSTVLASFPVAFLERLGG
jgi:(1->4)-alpha-D-glucan 1-alpha-D-glucosylmutase